MLRDITFYDHFIFYSIYIAIEIVDESEEDREEWYTDEESYQSEKVLSYK
jgi:hypothetical protein